MQVRLKDNLGSRDAESMGLDFRQCLRDSEIEVADDLAKRLVDGRFAVAVPAVQPPLKVKGVKKPDIQSDAADKPMEPEAVPKGVKKTSE